MARADETDYRHSIVCGVYANLGAVSERLEPWRNPDREIWSAEERAHLIRAHALATEARREVEVLLGPAVRSTAPFRERGTYPDDSLGAAIIRVQDHAAFLCATFT